MRKLNSKKLMENLYKCCYYFFIWKQDLYLKSICLQISLLEYYKKTESPLWTLFQENPEAFYEVKGEWSLAKITDIILTKKVHLSAELSSKYYFLSKMATEFKQDINVEAGFFGYKKYSKNWNENSEEVIQLIDIIKEHIQNILNDVACFYPKIQSYHYPKYSKVEKDSIDDLSDIDKERLVFNLEDLMEEIEKSETLLLKSKSGHEYYKIDIPETEIPVYPIETNFSDKVPGKVLDYRYNKDEELEILMKWKYLSLEDSNWVLYQNYKQYYAVKAYYIKYIKKSH